jgi:hypothetical protein
VIVALSFPHYLGIRLEHYSVNVASPDLLSEQSPFFRLALMHGFQVFAVPAANKLLGNHRFQSNFEGQYLWARTQRQWLKAREEGENNS